MGGFFSDNDSFVYEKKLSSAFVDGRCVAWSTSRKANVRVLLDKLLFLTRETGFREGSKKLFFSQNILTKTLTATASRWRRKNSLFYCGGQQMILKHNYTAKLNVTTKCGIIRRRKSQINLGLVIPVMLGVVSKSLI